MVKGSHVPLVLDLGGEGEVIISRENSTSPSQRWTISATDSPVDESKSGCLTKFSPKTLNYFRCKSGKYIHPDLVCDGVGACENGEDEDLEMCDFDPGLDSTASTGLV